MRLRYKHAYKHTYTLSYIHKSIQLKYKHEIRIVGNTKVHIGNIKLRVIDSTGHDLRKRNNSNNLEKNLWRTLRLRDVDL